MADQIKSKLMRDAYLPTASERFQSRGLLGVLTGPTERDKLLANAYAQFAQGVPAQPGTTVGAGPLEGGFVPTGINPLAEQTMDILGFQTPQRDVGGTPAQPAGDPMALIQNLIGAGPEGQKLALDLMGGLASTQKKSGMERTGFTNTLLAARAEGINTGIDAIDSIDPDKARDALRNLAGVVTTRNITPEGEETTETKSKVDVFREAESPSVHGKTKLGGFTPVEAGKVKMMDQAITDLDTGISMLYPNGKEGGINKTLIMQASARVGQGRKLRSLMRSAIKARVLAETGVTARTDELEAAVENFLPSPMDLTAEGLPEEKLKRLKEFMTGTLDLTRMQAGLRKRLEVARSKKEAKNKTKSKADILRERIRRQTGG